MGKKNVTISVDEDIYTRYSKFCKKKGWVLSRQLELAMEEHLNNHEKDMKKDKEESQK